MQTYLPAILPETVDFMRQVELNRCFEGSFPLVKLTRLNDVLHSSDGDVTASVEFCRSVGYACLKANVSAILLMKCQRCLDPIETKVEGNFKFALIHSEEESELLPDELEPYLLEGEEQSIIDLIEDELLLSLPMVTIHTEACSAFMTKQDEKVKAEKEAAHPFAALKALKK